MTPAVIIDLFREAMLLVIMIVCIMVIPSLLVGLVISMFQAATQINEQTLSFLPRLLMTLITIMVMGPWILAEFIDHFHRVFSTIPLLIG